MAVYGVIGPKYVNDCTVTDYNYVADFLDQLEEPDGFISGGSAGFESFVQRYSEDIGVDFQLIPPKINKYGTSTAFSIRNQEIIKSCDIFVVFWAGNARAFKDAVAFAAHYKRKTIIIPV